MSSTMTCRIFVAYLAKSARCSWKYNGFGRLENVWGDSTKTKKSTTSHNSSNRSLSIFSSSQKRNVSKIIFPTALRATELWRTTWGREARASDGRYRWKSQDECGAETKCAQLFSREENAHSLWLCCDSDQTEAVPRPHTVDSPRDWNKRIYEFQLNS